VFIGAVWLVSVPSTVPLSTSDAANYVVKHEPGTIVRDHCQINSKLWQVLRQRFHTQRITVNHVCIPDNALYVRQSIVRNRESGHRFLVRLYHLI